MRPYNKSVVHVPTPAGRLIYSCACGSLFKEFHNFYKFATTGARGILWTLRPSLGKTNRHEENMWLLGHFSWNLPSAYKISVTVFVVVFSSGIFVNTETTSKLTNMSVLCKVIDCFLCTSISEFFIRCSDFPTNGLSRTAKYFARFMSERRCI